MANKTRENYSPNSDGGAIRDSFQTPRYATELLIPFIPAGVTRIWECAAGDGRMVGHLEDVGFEVKGTTLNPTNPVKFEDWDYLFPDVPSKIKEWQDEGNFISVTNPPFSIKQKFYQQAKSLGFPFAFLIPADWSGWIVDAFVWDGAEAIIPNRRIDYITPHVLRNIARGELWNNRPDLFGYVDKKSKVSEDEWNFLVAVFGKEYVYEDIDSTPTELLRKYSSSDFHSKWLTWGFKIGKSHTFVDLKNSDKMRIK